MIMKNKKILTSNQNKGEQTHVTIPYGIEEIGTPLEILESIAEARRYLLKGGDIDYDRACMAILDDFRKGKLGEITL